MANKASAGETFVVDGSWDWSGGVDSSKVTTLQSALNKNGLPRDMLAWLNNATVRGNGIVQRAGWQPLVRLPGGYWQGGTIYEPDAGFPYLVCVISGVVYAVDLQPPYQVTDLTFGDPNLLHPSDPAKAEMCFFQQAESYLVIQAGDYFNPGPVNPPLTDSAGRTLPLFWDGTGLRRSVGIISPINIPGVYGHLPYNEIPAATAMDYYENRLWYAQGRKYSAGDIVGDQASGDPAVKFRDAVLKVTENPLAIGGDGFTVPTMAGNIRAIVHAAQLNASLGQGSLYVGTRKTIYNPQVPITRSDWIGADTSNMPSQPIVQLVNGPCGHRSIIPINGDLYYQAFDPAIRSLIRAVQYFAQPGNTAISQNVNRALQYNDRSLMRFASSIYFDSRFLTLVLPQLGTDGVNIIHRAILALDFDVVTNFSGRNAAVWEGAYDGLQFIELIAVDYEGQPRALAAVVSDVDNTMELWELTNNSKTENGDNRVTWSPEFPAYTWASSGYEAELKQLCGGELWVDRVSGTVQMDVYYRPDADPCWRKWFDTQFCAARNEDIGLGSDAYPCMPINEGYVFPIVFPEPCSYDCDAMKRGPTTLAYQFQVKIVIKGFCRIRGLLLHAEPRIKPQYQGLSLTSCKSNVTGAMATLPFPEEPQVMPTCVPPGTFPARGNQTNWNFTPQKPLVPPDITPPASYNCSIITASPLPSGKVLSSYVLQIDVQSDLPGWLATITSGSLPPGLTMSNNGNISGTPQTAGTYTFQVTVRKTTFMTCQKDFVLVVNPLSCAIGTDAVLPGGIVGGAYSTQLAGAFDVPPTAWTVTAGTLPTGLTLHSDSGIIDGTPSAVQTQTFTVTATGPNGMTCSKAFTLSTALPTCVITSDTILPDGAIGNAYSVQLTVAAQANVTSWNVTAGTLPTGLSMDAAGLITGTPSAVQTKTFTVTVTGESGMTCSKQFTIHTLTAPCAITAFVVGGAAVSGANLTMYQGVNGVIEFKSNPVILDGVSGTWSCTIGCDGLPAGVAFGIDVATHLATIMGYPPLAPGVAAFIIRATLPNGHYCEKQFSLHVFPPSDCDLVANQTHFPFSFSRGQHVNYQCTYTSSGSPVPPLTWSVSSGTLPPGLSLNSSTGLISGTIPNSAAHGDLGTFGLHLADAAGMRCTIALSWFIL